jgi:hypothetical protein
MMRKPVFPRFVGLLGLYSLIFVVIVSVQFAGRETFSLQIGNLQVEGRSRVPKEGEDPAGSLLVSDATVIFGGLEFRLPGDSQREALTLLDDAGGRYPCSPVSLTQGERGFSFSLTGGVELLFAPHEDGTQLWITGNFNEGAFSGLELPCRLRKGSRIEETGTSRLVISSGSQNYYFNRDREEGWPALALQKGGAPLIYGVVGEEEKFKVEDYILAGGEGFSPYREALARWIDQNYTLWNRLASSRANEDMLTAYLGEALQRGAYKAALAAVPRSFLSSSRRSYLSSVYLGDMNTVYRDFLTEERGRLARFTQIINEDSPDFLLESHGFEYLELQGQAGLFDQALALIQNLDSLTAAHLPGLLEALADLMRLRPRLFEDPAAFEAPISQAQDLLAGFLRRTAPGEAYPQGMVLAVQENRAETEWNLRLGKALSDWGEAAGKESWAAVGRSIVLSVLSLEDQEGRFVPALDIDEQGKATAGESPANIDAGRFYRLLRLGDYRPKALAPGPAPAGLEVWTASPEVRVARDNQTLDIIVNFPQGESHYMLIRGIGRFYQLQFHGMEWRTDPNFERYDSSGWAYHAPEQTLILKVKHRAPEERIRLYTGSQPASVSIAE